MTSKEGSVPKHRLRVSNEEMQTHYYESVMQCLSKESSPSPSPLRKHCSLQQDLGSNTSSSIRIQSVYSQRPPNVPSPAPVLVEPSIFGFPDVHLSWLEE
ncbi:hypothetical protein L1887_39926 [Cichorium endivia]|nr:hypothetical protein L1887_39926 [Cichorium endivia]